MTSTPLADEHGFEIRASEEPPEHIYDHTALISAGLDGFGAVVEAEIARFHEQGYMVIHSAFTQEQITDSLAAILDLIAGKSPAYDGVMYEAKARGLTASTSIETQDTVRKLAYFVGHDARLKAISEHPPLLHLLERIIGEPPDMFQDMALLKPPLIGREKPWHQDSAYFDLPIETTVVGVWIALDEATVENGCMHIIPGTQRAGPVVHFQRRDWQICDTDVLLGQIAAVPLKPGSCLVFHGLLHHGTPPSRSSKRRRALQFHYKAASVSIQNDSTERLANFGEEGKDVYC